MKNVNMTTAKKRYNSIMNAIGSEHNTIGERWSEDTANWNLRDMVAECDYQLTCYREGGHCNSDLIDGTPEERKKWRSDVGRLERFINTYGPFVEGLVCAQGHSSRLDNN